MIFLLRITHMMSECGCVWIQGCPVPADPAHVTCRPSRWNVALTWLRRLHTQTGKCCISEMHVQSVIRCLLVRLSAQLTIGSYLLPTILNLMSIFNSSVKIWWICGMMLQVLCPVIISEQHSNCIVLFTFIVAAYFQSLKLPVYDNKYPWNWHLRV